MKQFINLSSIVLNKLHITEIAKTPGKYSIYMSNRSVNGTFIGSFIFLYGTIHTDHNVIEICETTHQQDYNTVTEWIKTLD
jgi:hypothetical protein